MKDNTLKRRWEEGGEGTFLSEAMGGGRKAASKGGSIASRETRNFRLSKRVLDHIGGF